MTAITRASQPTSFHRSAVFLALLIAVGLPPLAAGCLGNDYVPATAMGGTGGSGAGGSGVCDAPGTLFKSTCGIGGCHDAVGSSSPDLASPGVFARLVDRPNTLSPGCMGQNLVNNSRPPSGVLLKRLTGMTCGMQMPYGTLSTVQEDVDCVTSWLSSQLPP